MWMTAPELLALPEAQAIFPTEGSLDWFVRENRAALVDAGVLILGKGRRRNLYSSACVDEAAKLLLIESRQLLADP